jgi:hypothetical protein
MFLYGGINFTEEVTYNDLYILDTGSTHTPMYMYIHTHAHAHAHAHAYAHAHAHALVYPRISTYMFSETFVCIHIFTHTRTHYQAHTHTLSHTQPQIHTLAHTYVHVYPNMIKSQIPHCKHIHNSKFCKLMIYAITIYIANFNHRHIRMEIRG